MSEYVDAFISHPDELFLKKRKIDFFYTLPKDGVDEETGILGIHTGNGIDPQNLFFKKSRQYFADKYNMIVFGTRFMGIKAQNSRKISIKEYKGNKPINDFQSFLNENQGKDLSDILTLSMNYDESIWYLEQDYFDFGLIQSIDIINTIKVLLLKFQQINLRKIFLFGSSMGAYISNMVGKFLPKTIKGVFDISGPIFIDKAKLQNGFKSKAFIDMNNTYVSLITHSPYDPKNMGGMEVTKDMLDIRNTFYPEHLYPSNRFTLFVTGERDHMVNLEVKEKQANIFNSLGLKNELIIVKDSDIDGKMFKHSGHSLGGNVFGIFDHFFDKYFDQFIDNNGETDIGKIDFKTTNGKYVINHHQNGTDLEFIWKE